MNKFENQEFKESDLGYDPKTLKPILKYPDVIDYFPNKKLEAIQELLRKSQRQKINLLEAKTIIEKQWEAIGREDDPEAENKFRFTSDGRLIDKNNTLAWKIEEVPEEKIPEIIKKHIRCKIYFVLDDRPENEKIKQLKEDGYADDEIQDMLDVWPGDLYIPYLDIIIISPFDTESNYWKTVLAHEIGHSILHQDEENTHKLTVEEKEEQADRFVKNNFKQENWFDETALHGAN